MVIEGISCRVKVLRMSKRSLGQMLLNDGVISGDQLDIALKEQKKTGEPLGEVLIRLGFAGEEAVGEKLAIQADVEFIRLTDRRIDPEVASLVPESLARRFRLVPVAKTDEALTVAMADVFDIKAVDQLTQEVGMSIQAAAASETDIEKCLERIYAEDEFDELKGIETGGKEPRARETEEGPIVRLVNRLIHEGLQRRATDIHLEPEEKTVRTRYRQDGILTAGPTLPKEQQAALINRIKIMSRMNISESRLPQDGRIDFKLGAKETDIRVSSFPTMFGETIVMRLLDRSHLVLGLDRLGLNPGILGRYRKHIKRANGIILVTGPTGAGKTTTLYSTLLEINSLEKKIVTIEDPIEYHFPMIRQSQVNPKAGWTFAAGLRSIFRQDPDIIFVGEIRDYETVEMAIRSSLTGHLVFSTLHTNDAPGAVTRLLDMGVEPYLLSSTLSAVMAQRLVRTLCPKCKRAADVSVILREELAANGIERIPDKIYGAAGCEECMNTGYKGRMGIFELLEVSKTVGSLINKSAPADVIRDNAREEGMRTMYQDGLLKIVQGLTTLDEVLRVTSQ